ncbi:hypothetical protein [uncultured Roseobacter sp.]|uniref:hypothetical protein n=1 Tax=uncultured Roseobacter sp. TaxID=114847 RepID=UPI0026149200|nr:hypothetical protein [uncultured Roseobacter sp.]
MAILIGLCNRLLNYIWLKPAFQKSRRRRLSYFIFFPPIASAGFPAMELAVAETFGFS